MYCENILEITIFICSWKGATLT